MCGEIPPFTHRISGSWFQPLWKILINCDDYSQYCIWQKQKSCSSHHQPDMFHEKFLMASHPIFVVQAPWRPLAPSPPGRLLNGLFEEISGAFQPAKGYPLRTTFTVCQRKRLLMGYTLSWFNIAIEHDNWRFVSFPMKSGGSFHSHVNVYWRVISFCGVPCSCYRFLRQFDLGKWSTENPEHPPLDGSKDGSSLHHPVIPSCSTHELIGTDFASELHSNVPTCRVQPTRSVVEIEQKTESFR